MPAILYRTYNVIPGAHVFHSFQEYPSDTFIQGANPDPPAWFDWITIQPYIFTILTGFSFTAPAQVGTYEIHFYTLEGLFHYDSGDTLKIVINVGAQEFITVNNCCSTEQNPHRNIAWFNIQGGWQNYIFTGVKTFRVEVGRNKQFKTNQYVIKHCQIEGVYDGEIITSGDIPKYHVDLLDNMRYSPQVFMFNEETQLWDIPLLLDLESFTKYKSRDKFFEVRLKFIYAEEILVQTQ